MLSPEDNELLTRVGPSTAMGALLRRYWIPVVQSSELEAGGRVKRVMLLGERLVAYRAGNGTPGLIAEFCPHRRASLYFGRVEEAGMRCVYRGWAFGLDGQCVDMPSEPPESAFAPKIHRRLSLYRAGRRDLDVHGPRPPVAAAAGRRVGAAPSGARLCFQARAGVQLVPGAGGRHRSSSWRATNHRTSLGPR